MSKNLDSREVTADLATDTEAQISSALLNVHTAIPAIVDSFNPAERTISAQPVIKKQFPDDGSVQGDQALPLCVDVPVVFPQGGGFEMTFPISKGDECLLVFSERCIDSWWLSGQPSSPSDFRQHDLSDAIAIVGLNSKPKAKEVWTGGCSIHGGETEVKLDGSTVRMTASGAQMTLSGSGLDVSVPINAPNVITPAMDVNGHVHGGVQSGSSNTGTGK